MNKKGFDRWSDDYDKDVISSNNLKSYPFDGYFNVITTVNKLIKPSGADILDIGIGSGKLSTILYKKGAKICGVDFSRAMIKKAKRTIPYGEFYLFDFKDGLPPELKERKFNYIISTYAIHHLNDTNKIKLIKKLFNHLKPYGMIIIADIAFETEAKMLRCKKKAGDIWDDDEIYITKETFLNLLNLKGITAKYTQISSCAAVITISQKSLK
jgi:putative AdoMet-dependent methyltransferase